MDLKCTHQRSDLSQPQPKRHVSHCSIEAKMTRAGILRFNSDAEPWRAMVRFNVWMCLFTQCLQFAVFKIRAFEMA